tara:strand:- start:410 stop:1342 length:933 start_codon:yes stop_codon:yes gene_type:complete
MNRGPEKLGRFLGAMIVISLCLLLSSCSTYRLATLNHDPIYGSEVVYLEVPGDTKIDTINSLFQLKRKLRTDFNFRWDFAQYAMQQPYSFYWSNPRLEGIWRPYNRFDVYFNSHHFWTDWAWGYNHYGWNSFYNWNRPWYYGWNRPYNSWNNWGYSWYNGPFNNPGYNVAWNSSRRNNVAYINGPRGSRNIIANNNIENKIIINRNKPRNNVINNIVNELRENFNVKPRVYNNPNNVPNNSKPIINNNNNNNNNIRIYNRPNNNNSVNSNNSSRIYTRPSSNSNTTTTRSSGNVSRSNSVSRGGNSNKRD